MNDRTSLRKVKWCAQGYISSKCWSQDLNSVTPELRDICCPSPRAKRTESCPRGRSITKSGLHPGFSCHQSHTNANPFFIRRKQNSQVTSTEKCSLRASYSHLKLSTWQLVTFRETKICWAELLSNHWRICVFNFPFWKKTVLWTPEEKMRNGKVWSSNYGLKRPWTILSKMMAPYLGTLISFTLYLKLI